MKNKKKLLGFSFYINIGNFEAFRRNLNLSTKHLFWRCGPGSVVNVTLMAGFITLSYP